MENLYTFLLTSECLYVYSVWCNDRTPDQHRYYIKNWHKAYRLLWVKEKLDIINMVVTIFMFCWPCIVVWSLQMTNWMQNFSCMFIFYSLHALGSHVPIVSMRHLVYVTQCRWYQSVIYTECGLMMKMIHEFEYGWSNITVKATSVLLQN